MIDGGAMSVDELKAREEELAREWSWLVSALHTVAGAKADSGEPHAFRLLHEQCRRIGQRRVELNLEIARLEGPPA